VREADAAWDSRVAALWGTIDHHEPQAFVASLARYAGEIAPVRSKDDDAS